MGENDNAETKEQNPKSPSKTKVFVNSIVDKEKISTTSDKREKKKTFTENILETNNMDDKVSSSPKHSVTKKRGRPQGSKNKVKSPDNPKKTKITNGKKSSGKITKPNPKETKSTPKVKDKSYIDTSSIIPESETKVKRLAAILSAEVDHYTYNTDDDVSEYEDYSFSRASYQKQKKKVTNKVDKTIKKTNEKVDHSLGWETLSDFDDLPIKKTDKRKDVVDSSNCNVRSSIESVISKIKIEQDSVSEFDFTCFKVSSPVSSPKSSPKKKQYKKTKEESCADDEESEDDQITKVKWEPSKSVKKNNSPSNKSTQKKRKLSQNATKRSKSVKAVTFASEDEESLKESDSEEDSSTDKRKKCRSSVKKEVAPPPPPRRAARMASLNARAVMHCMSEDARMPFHSGHKNKERSLALRAESTIAKRHPNDDSEDDTEDDSVEIRRFSGKRKKETTSEKVKKVRKKRRGELDVQMDMCDMVVTKRMASLNASAIMAASYSVESRKRTPCHAASSSAESEVTNLKIKRKISYKSTKSKGNKSRSVITVQETTKKLKNAEGTRETKVEEHIIVKKKIKRHSGVSGHDDTDERDDEDENVTDASELNHDEIIPKIPEDGGMIVESTITYITTQTDTSPQTVSVSGVSSYCISSGDRKTTTVVQQVARKSKTTTTSKGFGAMQPSAAFIPPTHYVQVRITLAVDPSGIIDKALRYTFYAYLIICKVAILNMEI